MDSEDFQTPRRQYLITYSRENLVKFPTRQSFGEAVVSCFHNSGKVTVDYWACCLEEHEHLWSTLPYLCKTAWTKKVEPG